MSAEGTGVFDPTGQAPSDTQHADGGAGDITVGPGGVVTQGGKLTGFISPSALQQVGLRGLTIDLQSGMVSMWDPITNGWVTVGNVGPVREGGGGDYDLQADVTLTSNENTGADLRTGWHAGHNCYYWRLMGNKDSYRGPLARLYWLWRREYERGLAAQQYGPTGGAEGTGI